MACLKAIHAVQPFALNSVDRSGRTALHVAVQGGQLGSVKQLCELGSDIETMDIRGRTPLHTAALFKTKDAKEIVVYLLDRGADLEKTDNEGDTALHLACKEANDTIASHLLNRIGRLDMAGQLVGRQNAKKQTALHLSCAAGMFNVVATLIEISTESLYMKDENGRLPLLAGAISDDHADCMALMLSVMQDADCRSDVHRRASSILSRSSMVDSTSQNTKRRSSNMVEEMNEFY